MLDKDKIMERLIKEGPTRWYHKFEVVKDSGIFTPGIVPVKYDSRFRTYGMTEEFVKGKRVLDIGSYTGALAFYFEDLGAEVVALDIHDPLATGFSLVHEIRNSNIQHRQYSIYELNPDDFGYFDIIAFFGVFYHLKHPILALERINSVCKPDSLLFGGGTGSDVWVHDDDRSCSNGANFSAIKKEMIQDDTIMSIECLNDLSIAGFAGTQYYGDRTNWFIPNLKCIEAWFKRTGFKMEKCTYLSAPIEREWNTMGVKRSSIQFLASYAGEPEPEYVEAAYTYNPHQKLKPIYQYRIPHSCEVERLERRIKELEDELVRLKNKA